MMMLDYIRHHLASRLPLVSLSFSLSLLVTLKEQVAMVPTVARKSIQQLKGVWRQIFPHLSLR